MHGKHRGRSARAAVTGRALPADRRGGAAGRAAALGRPGGHGPDRPRRSASTSLWLPDHLLYRFPDARRTAVGVLVLPRRPGGGHRASSSARWSPAPASATRPCWPRWPTPSTRSAAAGSILGLGAGWHEPEYQAFGYPFDHRVSRFEEALTIIHGLLRTGQVDFAGQVLPGARVRTAPARPAPGRPADHDRHARRRACCGLTARYADQWNAWLGLRPQRPGACRRCARRSTPPAGRGGATRRRWRAPSRS